MDNLSLQKKENQEFKFSVDDKDNFHQSVKMLLKNSIWPDIQEFKVERLSGGTTNILYKCTRSDVTEENVFEKRNHSEECCEQRDENFSSFSVVLIRVYGASTNDIIDREYEIQLFNALGKQDLHPKLFSTFENGYLFEYIEGVTLIPSELRDPKISKLIAKKCAKWHHLELPGKKKPQLWKRFNNWLAIAQESGEKVLPSGYTFDGLASEVASLREFLESIESPCVSAHNDLTAGNLIYDKSKESVTFIDFEYSGYNYRGFDLGNYFCEWSGLELDFTKYPNKDQQQEFLLSYLEACKVEDTKMVEELENIYTEVNAFALASHLLWALWAFIQTQRSSLDFDYKGYATKRLKEYYKKKKEIGLL